MSKASESHSNTHHDHDYSKTLFGFWIYIITDFMMFATFFATYAVLRTSTFGGPSAQDLFEHSHALMQTLLLLCCAFTSGLGGASAYRNKKGWTIAWFVITFILGIVFMKMEFSEFLDLINSGNGWQRSAFLSTYFTLVGTHGLHMIFALLWIVVLIVPVISHGITPVNLKRLSCLRMFWQFLNVVWIFIFSIVYLMGAS